MILTVFFSFNLILFGFPAVESKLAPSNDHFSYLCLWVLFSHSSVKLQWSEWAFLLCLLGFPICFFNEDSASLISLMIQDSEPDF